MKAKFDDWFGYLVCLIWPIGLVAALMMLLLFDGRGPWLKLGSFQLVALSLLLFCALEIAKLVPVYRRPIFEWRNSLKFLEENRPTVMWHSLEMAETAFFVFNVLFAMRENWLHNGFWTPSTSLPLFEIFLAILAVSYIAIYVAGLRRMSRERAKADTTDSTPTSA